MARVFEVLKPGDLVLIEGTTYAARGRMTLRTPDQTTWNEWLLVPERMGSADAIERGQHRWLAREDSTGLTLWWPTELASKPDPSRLSRGDRLTHGGRDYRLLERDEMRVVALSGDVGGDAAVGEQFEYLDLQSGLSLMTVEWNARGVDVCVGRRIGDHELVQWTNSAGNNLLSRTRGSAASLSVRKPAVASSFGEGLGEKFIGYVIVIPLVILMVMLEDCSGPDDCRQRVNPQTGQTEQVCEGGIRGRSGRGFGGWGGK